MSAAQKGKTLGEFSISRGITIYVNDSEGLLVNTFTSANKAAVFYNSNHPTILKYAIKGILFKDKWYLSFSISAAQNFLASSTDSNK